jgi:hypothetical protein
MSIDIEATGGITSIVYLSFRADKILGIPTLAEKLLASSSAILQVVCNLCSTSIDDSSCG